MRRRTESGCLPGCLKRGGLCTLFVNYWTNHPLSGIISPLENAPEQDVRWIQLKTY